MSVGFAVASTTSGLSKSGVLSLLLTTESLLFAALTVAVTLSATSMFGQSTWGPPWVLAFIATVVLAVVASGAVLAWTDLFLARNWPNGSNARLEALALLVAIVGQPLVALVIAIGIWRGRRA